MKDSDRFKLYFGPYKTPRFKYGKKVWCEYRGWMKIVGLSDAKIPWPIGRLVTAPIGRDSLIIYQGLKRAIEKEFNQGVAHWWGVSVAQCLGGGGLLVSDVPWMASLVASCFVARRRSIMFIVLQRFRAIEAR